MGVRSFSLLLIAGLLLGSVGCQASNRGDCCDDGCGQGREFAFMKYDACAEQCGDGFPCGQGGCSDPCAGGCDDCADTCCDAPCDTCCGSDCDRCAGDGCGCQCRSSGGWFSRACRKCGLDCAGCGEFYWCEWQNDPPACCEPCDCHGNYIGPGEPGYYRAPYREPELAP